MRTGKERWFSVFIVPSTRAGFSTIEKPLSVVDGRAWGHMLKQANLALITVRQQSQQGKSWSLVGASNCIVESCAISNKTREINYVFPLYTYPSSIHGPNSQSEMHDLSLWPVGKSGRRPNLDPKFVDELAQLLNWTFVPDGTGNLGQVPQASKSATKPQVSNIRTRRCLQLHLRNPPCTKLSQSLCTLSKERLSPRATHK